MRTHLAAAGLLSLTTALALSACGSSPTSPGSAGVTLRGVATGSGIGLAPADGVQALSSRTAAGGRSIVVTVQESPSTTTTISTNGTFELDDLPAGTLTLVFTSNGATIGAVTITSVPNRAVVDLVVQVSETKVAVMTVKVNGTAQVENESEATSAKTCLIDGGTVGAGIELEGSISSATGRTFQMAVNGQRASGTVSVDASSAGFDCAGIKGSCDATLIAAGAKVHVSGKLTSCSLTAAQVQATRVKFQH